MALQSREIRLARRPDGWPDAECFTLATVEVADPLPGQIVIRNVLMTVDPYMRNRMNDAESYVAAFRVGEALDGGAVGEVVNSTVEHLKPGDMVQHFLGWREYAVIDGALVTKVDLDLAPAEAYLGVLGMPGLTAYAGLLAVGRFVPGDVVFVSSAAGAVGQLAGQLARLKGAAKVIGSAGSAEKISFLTDELGFDAAFNYREAPVADQLRTAAPQGIDLYFDNVGGDHLEAAISSLRTNGRIVACGMISGYNAAEAPCAPRNLGQVIGKRLTMRGMLSFDHLDLMDAFVADVAPMLADDRIRYRETVVEGLARAPQAFLDMMHGELTGKVLVRIAGS